MVFIVRIKGWVMGKKAVQSCQSIRMGKLGEDGI